MEAPGSANRSRLAVAFGIARVILAAEIVGANVTGSLALIVDAGHMLTDREPTSLWTPTASAMGMRR
jgi:cobalt-zinc-cadmium efflux system protein